MAKRLVENLKYFFIEHQLFFLISAIFLLISLFIFGSGLASQGDNFVYTGITTLTPGDYNVYYSYIQQVKSGQWLFKDLFTSESHQASFFNLFFWSNGLLAKFFNLAPVWALFLYKMLLIPLGVWVVYLLVGLFVSKGLTRNLTLGLAFFGSGCGFLLYGLINYLPTYQGGLGYYNIPMDLWVPEFSFFTSLIHLPHQILSFSFLLLTFYFFLLAETRQKIVWSLGAGLSALILIQSHPFYLVTVLAVLGSYLLIQTLRLKKIYWFGLKNFFVIIILCSPAVIYWLWLMKVDWLVQIRNFQNVLPTTIWYLTLASYFPWWLFASLGAWSLARKSDKNTIEIFLLCWFIVGAVLIYSPVAFQRRLVEGWWLPLVVLSVSYLRQATWLIKIIKFLRTNNWQIKVFCFLVGGLIILSNLFIVGRHLEANLNHWDPVFILRPVDAAFSWLKNNTKAEAVILAGDLYGNFIPGWTNRTVYAGHGVETVWFHQEKFWQVVWLLRTNNLDDKKAAWLRQNKINYLFYSDNEKAYGSFSPAQKDYLQLVYQNSAVSIYQVIN
ncbi:MAG: hypothetical protein WCW02_03375 [Candidatus Buchananbacteria bacterium]